MSMPLSVTTPSQKISRLGSSTEEHATLLDELYERYGRAQAGSLKTRWGYRRKAWMWRAVVSGSVALKRAIDIVVASSALTLLLPLFLLVALLIKLTDGGPILFSQTRIGQWGKKFELIKFRSMVVNAEDLKHKLAALNDHKTGITFKMRRDPRVTWIGRIIRKSSIDELPQLWSVLKGELSLVGPRPAVPREVESYSLLERRRLEVQPGLTCIWQVSGRGDLPFDRQVELDVQYIHSQSVWLDLLLVLRTIPAVLTGRGAY